jgi:selenium metabolism protein YedF
MASTLGWLVSREDREDAIQLRLRQQGATNAAPEPSSSVSPTESRVAVFITSDQFGAGDEQLGQILMRAFIKTLKELSPLPEVAIFANSGVYLTTGDSVLLPDLHELASQGVRILSCGTCLDYYHLKEDLKVGQITNMFEIASTMAAVDRVLRP